MNSTGLWSNSSPARWPGASGCCTSRPVGWAWTSAKAEGRSCAKYRAWQGVLIAADHECQEVDCCEQDISLSNANKRTSARTCWSTVAWGRQTEDEFKAQVLAVYLPITPGTVPSALVKRMAYAPTATITHTNATIPYITR